MIDLKKDKHRMIVSCIISILLYIIIILLIFLNFNNNTFAGDNKIKEEIKIEINLKDFNVEKSKQENLNVEKFKSVVLEQPAYETTAQTTFTKQIEKINNEEIKPIEEQKDIKQEPIKKIEEEIKKEAEKPLNELLDINNAIQLELQDKNVNDLIGSKLDENFINKVCKELDTLLNDENFIYVVNENNFDTYKIFKKEFKIICGVK